MLSGQSTEAVGCFLRPGGILQFLGENWLSLTVAAASGVMMFALTTAARVILGEYIKESYFSRFRTERRKLKDEGDRLARAVQQLERDVDYAATVLGRLQAENERLLVRAIQAEQLLLSGGSRSAATEAPRATKLPRRRFMGLGGQA